MKKLLWVLILLLLPLTAWAEDAEIHRDGAFFYQIADGEAILTGCDWDAMQADSLYMFAEPPVSLEIPATLGGYPVTAIGGWLFSSLDVCPVDAPFEVVFPEGLRALDADTFAECFYAVKVTLPATLEIIPEGCFDQISAEIEFPNGNPRYSCENGFLIDNTTQTLLYTAPSSHGNPLPAVRRLGDCSLMNWLWDDDDDPVLPDTLESVGSYIFYDCGVTRVTFPDGITELSPYTFYCTDLQEVHLPASLREIPDYCFWNCQLIALTIPDGVTRIGAHAVDWFTGEIIGAVTLPASVEFVGYRAFPDECDVTVLNPQVHFETATEYAERIPEYDWYGDEAADVLYSDGLFDYELSSRGAVLLDCSRFLNQPEVPDVLEIPELGGTPVVAIAANALNTSESCADSLLFGIVLPEGVQRVEADAFQCCHAATQISFPSTLTMLAEGSFFHVYAEIDFPNGNPRYSCENGFLIDRDTQTLLYAAPSSQGQPIPAVRRLGDSALDNWKPAGHAGIHRSLRLGRAVHGRFFPAGGADSPRRCPRTVRLQHLRLLGDSAAALPGNADGNSRLLRRKLRAGRGGNPGGRDAHRRICLLLLRLGADGIVRRHPARVGGICGLPRLPGRMRNHRAKPRHAL